VLRARSALIAIALLLATAAGCHTPTPPSGAPPAADAPAPIERTTLKVAYVPVLAFGPLYRGLAKDYFSAAGIDVDLTVVQSASDAIAFLANGQLDVALGNVGAPFFNAVNRGLEVRVVAGNSVNPPDAPTLASAPMLVRRQLVDDGLVKSPADLKGRKVAINAPGGIQEYSLGKVLEGTSLSMADLEVQMLAFPDMLAALTNGAIDVAMVPEPFSATAREQGVAAVLVPNPSPSATVTAVLFGGTLLSPDKERVARAFLGAMRKAANELQTEQEIFAPENLTIWNQYTKVPEADIAKGAPYTYARDLALDPQSLLDQQQFLIRAGRVDFKEPLPQDKIVDTRFAERM